MINPQIALMGRQQDSFSALDGGLKMGQGLRQLVVGREIGNMNQIDDENERKAFADKSMFRRELNSQLKADASARQKLMYDQLKTEAEIAKISSEAGKNNAQTGGFNLDNSGKLLTSANQALMVAARTGDPMAAKLALNNAFKAGAVNPEVFDQYNGQIDVLGTNPEALKQFISGITWANAKDPASLMFTTADNVLDNETSIANNRLTNQTSENNNIRTTDASRYSTDKTYETNEHRLNQDQNQFNMKFEFDQQQADIRNSQVEQREYGGFVWLVDKQGQARKMIDENGQPVTATKAETPEQKMDRTDNILGAEDAHRSAMRAVQDAKNLMNHPGLYWGTGATSLLGSVPGTDAKDFQAQIENLKSQVFLPAVKAMQGMGALSNSEGDKISASIANLDYRLGPEAMKKQLTILAEQMQAAADLASKKMQNYASRGGTISPTQSPQQTQPQANRPPLASLFE